VPVFFLKELGHADVGHKGRPVDAGGKINAEETQDFIERGSDLQMRSLSVVNFVAVGRLRWKGRRSPGASSAGKKNEANITFHQRLQADNLKGYGSEIMFGMQREILLALVRPSPESA